MSVIVLIIMNSLSARTNDKKGMTMAKPSKSGDKKKSADFPDWASQCDPKADKRGPRSEYSKIQKACERGGLSS